MTTEKRIQRAIRLGSEIGRAMARDVMHYGYDRTWTGLDAQDGDRLLAAGIDPDTVDWEAAVDAAEVSYTEAIKN